LWMYPFSYVLLNTVDHMLTVCVMPGHPPAYLPGLLRADPDTDGLLVAAMTTTLSAVAAVLPLLLLLLLLLLPRPSINVSSCIKTLADASPAALLPLPPPAAAVWLLLPPSPWASLDGATASISSMKIIAGARATAAAKMPVKPASLSPTKAKKSRQACTAYEVHKVYDMNTLHTTINQSSLNSSLVQHFKAATATSG